MTATCFGRLPQQFILFTVKTSLQVSLVSLRFLSDRGFPTQLVSSFSNLDRIARLHRHSSERQSPSVVTQTLSSFVTPRIARLPPSSVYLGLLDPLLSLHCHTSYRETLSSPSIVTPRIVRPSLLPPLSHLGS